MSGISNEMTSTRRGFLGLLVGALAAPVVAPIIAPKRSFFSFFLPKRLIEPDTTFDLQKEIDAISKVGGGIVRIPEGVYVIGKSIILPDDVSMSFEGRGLISECHFTGTKKGVENPRGIFISEIDEEQNLEAKWSGKDQGLVTNCYFDINGAPRPAIEVVLPKSREGGS